MKKRHSALRHYALFRVISLFLLLPGCLSAQLSTDSLFVYNEKLEQVSLSVLLASEDRIALVSSSSCGGCTEYLLKNGIAGTAVFFIHSLNLLEIAKLKEQYAPHSHGATFYFVLPDFHYDTFSVNERSPELLIASPGSPELMHYDSLFAITDGFTLGKRKALRQLKRRN
jgi:hypothetical protein